MRRYHIQKRDDYVKYNKLAGSIKKLVSLIKNLHQNDPFRIRMTDALLVKLYVSLVCECVYVCANLHLRECIWCRFGSLFLAHARLTSARRHHCSQIQYGPRQY
jgi:hypothetical protein